MILYPTETLYGLGVGVFDEPGLKKLFELKARNESNSVLWMVRNIHDVKKYAEVDDVSEKIMNKFLPGPLSIILPLKEEILEKYPFCNKTVGFRISSDPAAQKVIEEFMKKNDMPLTSTSANISGHVPGTTVSEILEQFGDKKDMVDIVIDDGIRQGQPSTIVEIKNGQLTIHREGQVSAEDIHTAI